MVVSVFASGFDQLPSSFAACAFLLPAGTRVVEDDASAANGKDVLRHFSGHASVHNFTKRPNKHATDTLFWLALELKNCTTTLMVENSAYTHKHGTRTQRRPAHQHRDTHKSE